MKKGLPMKRYVVRRLLMAIPLLLAISFICFCFINLIPSNPRRSRCASSRPP